MTDLEDFLTNLFRPTPSAPSLKSKVSFFDTFFGHTSWVSLINQTANIFAKSDLLEDLSSLGSIKWADIFSKGSLLSDLATLGSGKWTDIFTKGSLLTDLSSLGSNKWADIFSKSSLLSDLAALGSNKWADIFKQSDLLDSLSVLGSGNWENILSKTQLSTWLGAELNWDGLTGLKTYLMKVLCIFLNALALSACGFQLSVIFQYNEGTGEIESTYVGENDLPAGYFTIEVCLYRIVRKLRKAIVDGVNATLDFADDVLPDEIQFFVPLFSGAGIKIAEKIDGTWELNNDDEWPDTYDPAVFHAYFKMPHLPLFDFCFVKIPIVDISQSNVYFNNEGTYEASRKYNSRDLGIDIVGFGGITLIGYLLSRVGMQRQADEVVKQFSSAGGNILNASATVVNNTVIMNKTLLSNMAGMVGIINSLFGSAANATVLNEMLDDLDIKLTIPTFDLENAKFTDFQNDLNALLASPEHSDILAKLREVLTTLGLRLSI